MAFDARRAHRRLQFRTGRLSESAFLRSCGFARPRGPHSAWRSGAAAEGPERGRGLRRRSAAIAIPRDRLVRRRRPGAVARQPDQPCRDAGAGARHPDGGAARFNSRHRHHGVARRRRRDAGTRSQCRTGPYFREAARQPSQEQGIRARNPAAADSLLARRADQALHQYPARRGSRACRRAICRRHRPDAHRVPADGAR
ncbi:hypothetical protein ACVIHF_005112 [Bradyrhizobium sp. USDA 4506]